MKTVNPQLPCGLVWTRPTVTPRLRPPLCPLWFPFALFSACIFSFSLSHTISLFFFFTLPAQNETVIDEFSHWAVKQTLLNWKSKMPECVCVFSWVFVKFMKNWQRPCQSAAFVFTWKCISLRLLTELQLFWVKPRMDAVQCRSHIYNTINLGLH